MSLTWIYLCCYATKTKCCNDNGYSYREMFEMKKKWLWYIKKSIKLYKIVILYLHTKTEALVQVDLLWNKTQTLAEKQSSLIKNKKTNSYLFLWLLWVFLEMSKTVCEEWITALQVCSTVAKFTQCDYGSWCHSSDWSLLISGSHRNFNQRDRWFVYILCHKGFNLFKVACISLHIFKSLQKSHTSTLCD